MQEQHPVPQQISSYQFRLVGDMTLKQFLELAGGALVGLLFYASNLPGIIKWPFIILSVLAGAALAFLPLEDRPLEVWILAFFKSIYSPTIFYWTKGQKEEYFQPEGGEVPVVGIIAPGGESQLKKYLSEKPSSRIPFLAKLEEAEKGFLSKVTGLLGSGFGIPKPVSNQPINQPPQISSSTTYSTTPAVQPQLAQVGLSVPQTTVVEVAHTQTAPQETPKQTTETSAFPSIPQSTQVPQTLPTNATTNSPLGQAQFSSAASPPMPPTQPNTISGQVMDVSGRIVESAILEIKDAAHRPVRAVKTNKLGHFFIVTPLSNGKYEIITEKEGYEFDPVMFDANGTMIQPIAIRARGTTQN